MTEAYAKDGCEVPSRLSQDGGENRDSRSRAALNRFRRLH
jgi:hypothetical protein